MDNQEDREWTWEESPYKEWEKEEREKDRVEDIGKQRRRESRPCQDKEEQLGDGGYGSSQTACFSNALIYLTTRDAIAIRDCTVLNSISSTTSSSTSGMPRPVKHMKCFDSSTLCNTIKIWNLNRSPSYVYSISCLQSSLIICCSSMRCFPTNTWQSCRSISTESRLRDATTGS